MRGRGERSSAQDRVKHDIGGEEDREADRFDKEAVGLPSGSSVHKVYLVCDNQGDGAWGDKEYILCVSEEQDESGAVWDMYRRGGGERTVGVGEGFDDGGDSEAKERVDKLSGRGRGRWCWGEYFGGSERFFRRVEVEKCAERCLILRIRGFYRLAGVRIWIKGAKALWGILGGL